MNIAAEELGRDIAFWESQRTLRIWCTTLVHLYYCCTTISEGRRKKKRTFMVF